MGGTHLHTCAAWTRLALCRWIEWSVPLLEAQRGPRAYSIRP